LTFLFLCAIFMGVKKMYSLLVKWERMLLMNKRLGTLLLAVVCSLFVFVSCNEQADAYELYLDMNKAMENITSMKVAMDGKMQMSVSGNNLDLHMKADETVIEHAEGQIDMAVTMEADMAQLGSVNTSLYVKDGYIYEDIMGIKMKIKADETAVSEISDVCESALLDFAKDIVIDSSVTKTDNGKELRFTLNGEKMTDALANTMKALTSSLGDNISYSFGDVTYTALVGEDFLPTRIDLSFSCDLTIEGEQASASYTLTTTDIDYNVTQIEYPADLDSYQLIDADLGQLEA